MVNILRSADEKSAPAYTDKPLFLDLPYLELLAHLVQVGCLSTSDRSLLTRTIGEL